MKRPLVIILIIVGAVALVGAGIYLRARTAKKTPQVTVAPATPGGLPTGIGSFPLGTTATTTDPSSGNPISISQSQAIAYAARPDGILLYIKPGGQIIAVTSASSTIVSTRKFSSLLDATFSADGRKVLVKSGDGASPRWSLYDTQKNSWRELPIDARDVRWAPEGYQIAYFSRRLVNQTLTTLDLQSDTLRPRSLLTLNAEDLDLTWIGPGRLAFGERASAYVPGSLWSFDTSKSALRSFLGAAKGLMVKWGRNNQGLVFTSRTGGTGGTLALRGDDTSSGGSTSAQTFSFLTLPEKCTFFTTVPSGSNVAEEDLICAIPRDTQAMAQAALPDDYQEGALVTQDDIYQISVSTGSFTPVMNDAGQKVDATRLQVTNSRLYFINRVDRKIYSIALP